MYKKILSLLALIAMCAVLFCGCGKESSWSVKKVNYAGEVSSNGGFLVEKGDYVYFINGNEGYTASNNFGSPVKGSLVRMKKSDVSTPDKAEVDVLVPKVLSSGDYEAGVYIYGDYVYYATPTSIKDKTGAIQNEYLDFCKMKLDGKNNTVLERVNGNATTFRFVEGTDGKVYIVYITTADSKTVINVFDNAGKKVFVSDPVKAYIFGDAGDNCMYFTRTTHNEDLDTDESFNDLYRYSFGAKEEEKLITGAGSYREDGIPGTGSLGVTYTLIKYTGGTLYYSYAEVSSSSSAATTYKAVEASTLVKGEYADNLAKGDVVSNGTNASTIFSSKSYYYAKNAILYVGDKGLMKYDYTKENDASTNFGVTSIYYDSTVTGATIAFVKGDFMYFTANSLYYRINLTKLLAGEKAELEQITYLTANTSWYNAEVVGDRLLVCLNATNCNGYIYSCPLDVKEYIKTTNATDLEGLTGKEYDEKLDELMTDYQDLLKGSKYENRKALGDMLCGKYSSGDKKTYDNALDSLKDSESNK